MTIVIPAVSCQVPEFSHVGLGSQVAYEFEDEPGKRRYLSEIVVKQEPTTGSGGPVSNGQPMFGKMGRTSDEGSLRCLRKEEVYGSG